MKQIIIKSVALASLASLVNAQFALAYVDPTVGGILFQSLAMVFTVLSGLVLIFSSQIRMALARARRFLRELFAHSKPQAHRRPVED